ncbi:hypothetical protein SAPIO_CDS6641 [Scedosporium apiospermum]|uniref:DASH complex subunit DAD1 n=1 Tax=Pseudallescheria apiosperma TaxID=563466 RepID=A0A084G3C3_PSEDA|nr:uncharacterized protein SAPIO_CDS6641 [Scedosporium apiospermum]KEZ41835.1 hypothetical protein SAPIO_CDS6641 [Scedosporium apiospermum]
MASQRPTSAAGGGKTYFEQQRELLIGEIAMSFEQVLANINKLNRSLESVITVGNEFSSVEALWSQFEGVMGKEEESGGGEDTVKEERGAKREEEETEITGHGDEEEERSDR